MDGPGLQNKPVLQSYYPFVHLSVIYEKKLPEAETNNSLTYGDSSTCDIKFSCSNFCVFYPLRNICYVLKITTTLQVSIGHKM